MEEKSIRKILEFALNYPSGDNMQPFDYKIKSSQLIVNYCQERGAHEMVINKMPILISYAAFLEYLSISASNRGYKIQIKNYFSESFSSHIDQKLAEVSFTPTETPQSSYTIEQLRNRITDRRQFSAISDEKVLNEILDKVELTDNVKVLDSSFKNSLEFFTSVDPLLWSWKKALLNFLKYVNFGKQNNKVGLPVKNLQLGSIDEVVIFLVKKVNFFFNIFKLLGAAFTLKMKITHLFKGSKFILFLDDSNDIEQQIKVLRKVTRFWILANSHGIGFQPLTLSSFILNNDPKDISLLKTKIGQKVLPIIKQGKKLKTEHQITSKIIWAARIGSIKEEFNSNHLTKRMDLNEVLSDN
jgi:hypothetical protein